MDAQEQNIPPDWQILTLADLGGEVTSGSRGWAKHYADHGSLFLRITNLERTDISLDLRDKRFVQVDPNDAEALRTRLQPGDLLISITADIGIIGYIDQHAPTPAYINQHIARVRLDERLADSRFVAYYLASWEPQRRFVGATDQGAKAGMNLSTVAALSVAVPSVAEQSRIAEALREIDDLIAALQRTIAKKRAVRQGLMQQLLTGRTRMRGFSADWQYRRVAEMGSVLAGKALNVNGAGTLRPYLRTKNVLDGRIDLRDILWMPMTNAEFDRFSILDGDVLLNEGQSLELVGRCSIYRGEYGAACAMQNQLLRFRAYSETSPSFAAHLFRFCQLTGRFSAIATKTTSVAHLGSSRFSKLVLCWPTDRGEQELIADALTTADNSISLLERSIVKKQGIKQGMMQQLLTGRTRLPT